MKDQSKCFEIKIKLECSHIRRKSKASRQSKASSIKQSIKPCKKSPSQLKGDKEGKQKFIDIKSKEVQGVFFTGPP